MNQPQDSNQTKTQIQISNHHHIVDFFHSKTHSKPHLFTPFHHISTKSTIFIPFYPQIYSFPIWVL
ncbi:hypothetical protein Hanom_Chr12g01074241 [Helianthus anomalus]